MSTEALEYLGGLALAAICLVVFYFAERRDHRKRIEKIKRRIQE